MGPLKCSVPVLQTSYEVSPTAAIRDGKTGCMHHLLWATQDVKLASAIAQWLQGLALGSSILYAACVHLLTTTGSPVLHLVT
jgi:hypothetical protein